MKEKWMDYLFTDDETGEEFLVETKKGLDDATAIAERYFKDPKFHYVMTPEMADILGLDTY